MALVIIHDLTLLGEQDDDSLQPDLQQRIYRWPKLYHRAVPGIVGQLAGDNTSWYKQL